MIRQLKIIAVLPAYNAEKTLEMTLAGIDRQDEIPTCTPSGVNTVATCRK